MKQKSWYGSVTFPLYLNTVSVKPIHSNTRKLVFVNKTIETQYYLDKELDRIVEEEGYTDVVMINNSTELCHILKAN